MTRPESTWLTLRAGLKDLLLEEHHHPYSIFKSFPSPEKQTPQMITLIGQHTKSSVMENLRIGSRFHKTTGGEVHLHMDPNTTRAESPILFADCELHNSSLFIKLEDERWLGDVVRRPLAWHRQTPLMLDPGSVAQRVYSKLITPFSNVICLFAEDLGGLQAVAEMLAVWLIGFSNRSSDLPFSTNPRVLILKGSDDYLNFDEKMATERFMLDLGREAEAKGGALMGNLSGRLKQAKLDAFIQQQFGGMRVIAIPNCNSTFRAWRSLRSRILQECNQIQDKRKEALVAFSAQHFKAFFHMASEHFCTNLVIPFSFINASRIPNPIPEELRFHISRFVKKVDQKQILNFAVPMISSALMFDSYPIGMHAFHPLLVFRKFYYHLCLDMDPCRTKEQAASGYTSSHLVQAIEVAFCEFAFQIIKKGYNGIAVHQKTLARFKEFRRDVYDHISCQSCLSRASEDTLDCKHSLCIQCTRSHGVSTELEPWTFCVKKCPLCEKPNHKLFLHKPDTAGIRAIIVEGGGIKGVIPLTFLMELSCFIDLPISLPDYFDIAFGSSSGALIILGLFVNKWSIKECLKQFHALSSLAFSKSLCSGLSLKPLERLWRFLEVLISLARDSRYSSSGITNALTSAFGNGSTLFESSAGGTKVAVVATTTKNSSTCIFTNYNGPRNRSEKCGYQVIRPKDVGKEHLVWQAARASSAAPPYFKSFRGFQDGGLGGHNNPINLALWEQDVIWSRQRKQPDIVLSLGTGYKRDVEADLEKIEKGSFSRDHCIPRLFRSFLNIFVGESRWQELQNSLEPQFRERYHRLNIEFCGDEPELDDIQAMPSLQQQAKFHAASGSDIRKCADGLFASFFYLELKTYPEFDGTTWVCRGMIRCRLGPSHPGLRALARRLTDTQARFSLDLQHTIPCIDKETSQEIESGQPFSLAVVFKVHSLEDFIDIKLDGVTARARSISNCPYKVKELISDQRLDRVFGYIGRKRTSEIEFSSRPASKRAKLVN